MVGTALSEHMAQSLKHTVNQVPNIHARKPSITGMVAQTFNPRTQEAEEGESLSESKASLIYLVNSRTIRTL